MSERLGAPRAIGCTPPSRKTGASAITTLQNDTTNSTDPAIPHPRGRDAASPSAIPFAGWKDVLRRTWREGGEDNIGLIAAGVAFYGFLSIVPLLGAVVLVYGLVAEPRTVIDNMRSLMTIMPADVARMIGEQLMTAVTGSEGKQGFGLLIALALALYGAMKGAGAIVTALNVVYEEREKRGFVWQNLVALAITAGAVVLAIMATMTVAAVAFLDALMPNAPAFVLTAMRLTTYALLAGLTMAAASTLYRYGPSRDHARWRWLTPGSVLATIVWLAMTTGFGLYVRNFGSYDATYGSLGALVVLLTWLWLSAYIFLLGAELNSELEHHVTPDTTKGPARPMGQRGATVSDTMPEDAAKTIDLADVADGVAPPRLPDHRGITATAGIVGSGMGPALGAAGGLALLRRGHPAGVAVLAIAGWLAWSKRPRKE